MMEKNPYDNDHVDECTCSDCYHKRNYIVVSRTKVEVHRKKKFCDENCNECGILMSPNNRQVSLILNILYNKFGDGVYEVVQSICPNLTCCADCHVDDFTHVEGCDIDLEAVKRI